MLGDEDGIDTTALIERRLQAFERHEDGANRTLRGSQRELAEIGSREDLANRQANRSANVLLSPVERLGWDAGGPRNTNEN